MNSSDIPGYDSFKTLCQEKGWKCRFRDRNGKWYVTVDWNHQDFKRFNMEQNSWRQALDACYSSFPKGHSTSGGMGNMTFRINP